MSRSARHRKMPSSFQARVHKRIRSRSSPWQFPMPRSTRHGLSQRRTPVSRPTPTPAQAWMSSRLSSRMPILSFPRQTLHRRLRQRPRPRPHWRPRPIRAPMRARRLRQQTLENRAFHFLSTSRSPSIHPLSKRPLMPCRKVRLVENRPFRRCHFDAQGTLRLGPVSTNRRQTVCVLELHRPHRKGRTSLVFVSRHEFSCPFCYFRVCLSGVYYITLA